MVTQWWRAARLQGRMWLRAATHSGQVEAGGSPSGALGGRPCQQACLRVSRLLPCITVSSARMLCSLLPSRIQPLHIAAACPAACRAHHAPGDCRARSPTAAASREQRSAEAGKCSGGREPHLAGAGPACGSCPGARLPGEQRSGLAGLHAVKGRQSGGECASSLLRRPAAGPSFAGPSRTSLQLQRGRPSCAHMWIWIQGAALGAALAAVRVLSKRCIMAGDAQLPTRGGASRAACTINSPRPGPARPGQQAPPAAHPGRPAAPACAQTRPKRRPAPQTCGARGGAAAPAAPPGPHPHQSHPQSPPGAGRGGAGRGSRCLGGMHAPTAR